MARPKFREVLPILGVASAADKADMAANGLNPDLDLSVCAMGPLEEGDEILAMDVWVWQEADGKVAACAGTAGVHLGSHDPKPSEVFPLKGTDSDRWMIQTQLLPHSRQLVGHKAALATGMALVSREGGVELEHWSQAVMIKPRDEDAGHQHGETHSHPSSPTT
jgi:hypothetical protein